MKQNHIDQAIESFGQMLKNIESTKAATPFDFKEVTDKIEEIVKAIPYNSISGDQIAGGKIKSFSSTGIDDSASQPTLSVKNGTIEAPSATIPALKGRVFIEDSLVANEITVLKDLTVSGVLRANVEVNYADFLKRIPKQAISQDLIGQGTIRNFASTGIRDQSTGSIKITIKDDAVYMDSISVGTVLNDLKVEKTIRAESAEFTGTIKAKRIEVSEIKSDLRLERTSSLEFKHAPDNPIYGKGLAWTGLGPTKQFVLKGEDSIFSTENIDLQPGKNYLINNSVVISEKELGPGIVKSRLREVGILKDLTVMGDSNLANFVFFNSSAERANIGIGEPNGKFSVFGNNIELKHDFVDGKAVFGTHGYQDLSFVTDNTSRVQLHNNGHITLGNKNTPPTQVFVHGKIAVGVNSPDPAVDLHVNGSIKFDNHLHTYGSQAPETGNYNSGDIVWNTDPKPNHPVGWVCTRAGSPGTWRPFGIIS